MSEHKSTFLNAVLLGCTSGMQFYCADSREFSILRFSDLWDLRPNYPRKKKVPRGKMSFLCLASSWSVLIENILTLPQNPLGLVFLSGIPPKAPTSWSEKERKGWYPESLGLPLLTLANVYSISVFWTLPLWDVQNSELPTYVSSFEGQLTFLANLLVPFWILFRLHNEDFHTA